MTLLCTVLPKTSDEPNPFPVTVVVVFVVFVPIIRFAINYLIIMAIFLKQDILIKLFHWRNCDIAKIELTCVCAVVKLGGG